MEAASGLTYLSCSWIKSERYQRMSKGGLRLSRRFGDDRLIQSYLQLSRQASASSYRPGSFHFKIACRRNKNEGRDRPFMSLQDYEQSVRIDSREINFLDREKDEELDAIALAARLLSSNFRRSNLVPMEELIFDHLPRVSGLALFVSDCFGGSDRSSSVLKFRKSIIGSNKLQPFICTCFGARMG